jgi:hypothetical protein
MNHVTGLLDDQELADALRVTKRVVGNMRRAKRIPCVKLSNHTIRFDLEEVIAALKANSEGDCCEDE